jgi:hypothetical protein
MVKVEMLQQAPDDPFAVFDSAAAVMAYVYRKFGGEALKTVLAEVPEADREFLEAQAAMLNAIGLPEIAVVVEEAAINALPANVLQCSYAETDTYNYESWQASHRRRHSK